MKQNSKKIAVVLHVLQTTQNWSFHVVVLKCTKIYNARAQLLFCSLNLLFGGVCVAFSLATFKEPLPIVVCLNFLSLQGEGENNTSSKGNLKATYRVIQEYFSSLRTLKKKPREATNHCASCREKRRGMTIRIRINPSQSKRLK